ncbi:hypothetical protein K0U27_08750 [archaeon]|nr:hypothetical protein [archaeon]
MNAKLLIVVVLSCVIAFACLIYVVAETYKQTVILQDMEKSTTNQGIREKTDYLEDVPGGFDSHPAYLAMGERFSDVRSRIHYDDTNTMFLEITTENDINGHNLSLYLYENMPYEKQNAALIFCNIGNSSVDELQDVDDAIIDYINSDHCFDIEQDSNRIYSPTSLSQTAKEDVEFLFERHPAYVVMKQRFPDSTNEIAVYEDGAAIGVDVDAVNPENNNEFKLRIYGMDENEIGETWTQCLVGGHAIIERKSNPPVEYMADTDCLEKKIDPEYVYRYGY